ncbi:MAG: hypothetical protein JSS12_07210 [Verrucomicrobia bacterium]|nr:hypothetical protein [Verrucomicrobiota bacterium]
MLGALWGIFSGGADLQGVLSTFHGEFSQTINLRFQTLYQRSSARKNIVAQHNLWAKELELLDTKMKGAWQRAVELYEKTPLDLDALSIMVKIDTIASHLIDKCGRVAEILRNPVHQQALIYYKETVKAPQKLPEEVNQYFDSLEKQPENVQNEIDQLRAETLEFIAYADSRVEHQQDAPRALGPFTVELPKENYFRNGQYLRSLPYIGYPEIYNEYMALQECAKGIYHLECRMIHRFDPAHFNEEVATDVRTLCLIEDAISFQRNRLKSKPLSNQIHAGWYYAAGLIAQAHFLQRALARQAEGTLLTSLRALSVLRTKGSIHELSAAALHLPENSRVRQVVNQLFERELTSAPVVSFTVAVFERSLNWHTSEAELECYLMRGFRECTPEFEAVLYRMERDPLYCKDFERTIHGTVELERLYQEYKKRQDRPLLKKMTDALLSLYEPVPTTLYTRFIRLHKAFQVYRSLKEPPKWFTAKLKEFQKLWPEVKACADEAQKIPLYNCLYTALFAVDEATRAAASNAVVVPETIEKGITKVLLYRWALERHVARKEGDFIPQAELNILKSLFKGYKSNPLFWQSQYDTGYMELAFHRGDKKLLLYAKFRQIIDREGGLVQDTQAHKAARDLYQQAQVAQIGEPFLTEIKEFIYNSRIYYLKL